MPGRRVLALTTSTDIGSVAVAEEHVGVIAETAWAKALQHGETVVTAIDQMLSQAGLNPADVDFLAVDKGPGSFTGARIAVNVGRTFAYGLGKPIHAACSLDILAQQAPSSAGLPLWVVIDAHKNLFYSAAYFAGGKPNPRFPVATRDLESIKAAIQAETLFVGPLTKDQERLFQQALGDKFARPTMTDADLVNYPHAKTLAMGCLDGSLGTQPESWTNIEPLYVRAPEAQEKLAAGALPTYDKRRRKTE